MSKVGSELPLRAKVLVIDADLASVRSICSELHTHQCECREARTGSEGVRQARAVFPQLVMLELALPDTDGLDVCKALRSDPLTARIPIIVASARSSELDRILCLECGADDFVAKPFNAREVALRIRNLLATNERSDLDEVLTFSELRIDIPRHTVTVDGRKISLTLTEFRLLTRLVHQRGRVVPRSQLVEETSERAGSTESRTIDTHMRRLRRKLGRSSRFLRTVYRIGYRFVDEEAF